MKILFSQPATLYYAWQTEVLCENLLQLGFNLNNVEVVCCGERTKEWNALAVKYAARFFFYPVTIQSPYPSIGRPHAIKKHFKVFPELANETILYIDCDVLFLQKPEQFLTPLLGDDIVYLSNTKWYIGYSYLSSKKKDVTKLKDQYDTDQILQRLLDQIGISLETLKVNDDHSGGAQYLLKGVDWKFWEAVEQDCTTIYRYFNFIFPDSVNRKYFDSENKGFQSFCADMWAVLWNLWKIGKKTRIAKELDFAWPCYGMQDKDKYNILHNAGVINDNDNHFYKSKYINRLPYLDSLDHIRKDRLTWIYTEKLNELRDRSCLLNLN